MLYLLFSFMLCINSHFVINLQEDLERDTQKQGNNGMKIM